MIDQVTLGDETHFADVTLKRLLTVMLDSDVLVNTIKEKARIVSN